ncbi:MAG: hypothetical protein ACOYJ1_16875 [Peptococcales bacterium]|jgi:hypothetical protein
MAYEENGINMFCVQCKDWIAGDWSEHSCPSEYWVVADKEMVGIVSKLNAMGITTLTAIWTTTELSDWVDYEYQITIKIDVGKRISEAVLGNLPTGWHYFWETAPPIKVGMHMIAFVERWYNLGFESIGERIASEIKRFEEFLDEKDAEAVKALLLLTSC